MSDLVPIRRALLSVSDKTDLAPFARALQAAGVEIISTGGTAKALREADVAVTAISDVTGFPEIMGGRVKTLHPAIHGGLLALRDDPAHMDAMKEHGFQPIDLLCVNLYPFERTVSAPGVAESEAVEQIDIGGPAMIRSAAKNFDAVAVVTAPTQYDRIINEMQSHDGATTRALRAELASAAFARTAEYDAAISAWLSRASAPPFPRTLRIRYPKVDDLRYGENPHQDAALYRDPASTGPTIVNARQLHGKPLSFNNINDAAAALELAKDLRRLRPDDVGAAVIKHTNACGAATAAAADRAVADALAGDSQAAYGGILAVNRAIDADAARAVLDGAGFLEMIAAPEFDDDALALLKERWVNVRLLSVGDRAGSTARKLDYRSIPGGMLVQDRDTRTASPDQWRLAAGPEPGAEALARAAVTWTIAKHLKSNAVAIGAAGGSAGSVRLAGAGVGHVDRLAACRLAIEKAGDAARGAVAASDAFFPFPDGPAMLIDAGVSVIVHPGGSKRDEETFGLCREKGVSCLVTGVRHFRH